MANNSMNVITTIRAQFEQLTAQITQLNEECHRLQGVIAQLQETVDARDARIEMLSNELAQSEVRYKNLQLSQKTELNTQQIQENKQRFAKLVREIDKCIALLNE